LAHTWTAHINSVMDVIKAPPTTSTCVTARSLLSNLIQLLLSGNKDAWFSILLHTSTKEAYEDRLAAL